MGGVTIPEELKTAAYALVEKMKSEDHGFKLTAYEFATAAMWAERQRCADVARLYLEDLPGCDLRDDEPELIAKAILAGS